MTRFAAGAIVIVDWRGGALPREPTSIRPGIVVENGAFFPADYPNVLVVPITRDTHLAFPTFSERMLPNAENGVTAECWALAHHVTSVSMQRISATTSCITDAQLASIRRRMALALGTQMP